MASTDSEGLDFQGQGPAGDVTRDIDSDPMPQKPVTISLRTPPRSRYGHGRRTDEAGDPRSTAPVVNVSDPHQPAKLLRSCMSTQSERLSCTTESLKSWELPTTKLSQYSSISPFSPRRSGCDDPRFRKTVLRPKTNDAATDTEDLCVDSRYSRKPRVSGLPKKLVAREQAEKPEDASLPVVTANCDCGVQTLDTEDNESKSTSFSKSNKAVRLSGSEISLGQCSCETKRSYSDTSLKNSDYWTSRPLTCPKPSKLYEDNWQELKLPRDSNSSKSQNPDCCSRERSVLVANCSCSSKKRPKFASRDVAKTERPTKDTCVCGKSTKEQKKPTETRKDRSKMFALVVTVIFLGMASFWVLTLLMQLMPLVNEWLYPAQDDEPGTLGMVYGWVSNAGSSFYDTFIKAKKCPYVGDHKKCQ